MSLVEKAPAPSICAVVGSRGYQHRELVLEFVKPLRCVISGGAKGVDTTAERTAYEQGALVVSFRPQFIKDGWKIQLVEWSNSRKASVKTLPKLYPNFASAAHSRNSMIVQRVVEESGALVAFWDGSSPGTKSVIEKATLAGCLYAVYGPEGEEL